MTESTAGEVSRLVLDWSCLTFEALEGKIKGARSEIEFLDMVGGRIIGLSVWFSNISNPASASNKGFVKKADCWRWFRRLRWRIQATKAKMIKPKNPLTTRLGMQTLDEQLLAVGKGLKVEKGGSVGLGVVFEKQDQVGHNMKLWNSVAQFVVEQGYRQGLSTLTSV